MTRSRLAAPPPIGGFAARGFALLILLPALAPAAAAASTVPPPPAAASSETKAGAQCPIPPHGAALSRLHDFQRASEFTVFVDGKEQPAEIYASESTGVGLLLSPAFKSAVVLSSGSVATLPMAKVVRKADGAVELQAGASPVVTGSLDFADDGQVRFAAEGRAVALRPQAPLLGLRRVEEVTAHNPEYVGRANRYQANPQAIAALRKEQRPVTVRVYYGSWCSHCRKLVPNGVRVEEALKASRVRFEYFGVRTVQEVPPGQGGGAAEIPTAVVLVDGAEVGRIVGDRAWQAPEVALRDLLAERSARSR